jgi:hypothetical protein
VSLLELNCNRISILLNLKMANASRKFILLCAFAMYKLHRSAQNHHIAREAKVQSITNSFQLDEYNTAIF